MDNLETIGNFQWPTTSKESFLTFDGDSILLMKREKAQFSLPLHIVVFVNQAPSSNLIITYLKEIKKKFRIKTERVKMKDGETLQSAIETLKKAIRDIDKRPRRVICLMNPSSGVGKSASIYNSIAIPYFSLSDIESKQYVTSLEGSNSIASIVEAEDFTKYDAVCLFGGDGTLRDFVTQVKKHKKEFIPIALIPTGTGNGISSALNTSYNAKVAIANCIVGSTISQTFHGVYDETTETLLSYAVIIVGYGFFGDMITFTEGKLGPKKYLYAFYKATVSAWKMSQATVEYETLTPNNDTKSVIDRDLVFKTFALTNLPATMSEEHSAVMKIYCNSSRCSFYGEWFKDLISRMQTFMPVVNQVYITPTPGLCNQQRGDLMYCINIDGDVYKFSSKIRIDISALSIPMFCAPL